MSRLHARLELHDDVDASSARTVGDYLRHWAGEDAQRGEVAALILAILEGARRLSRRIAFGALPGDMAALVGNNTDGDSQKRIDVAAHELFVDLLIKAGAGRILSEEAEATVDGVTDGKIAVAIDPLDGSGNVGIGAPLGTLFSLLPMRRDADPFLVEGNQQVAAGYICYGNSVELGFSVGSGVILATLLPQDGGFRISHQNVRLPAKAKEIAYNASVYRHLLAPMRAYVDDCQAGKEGPRGRDFNMRWYGAAVAELHRILCRGGMFFYAGDKRPGYAKGRLRLVYEAFPIAFLCAQAQGKASDGLTPILSKKAAAYHERSALVFGAADEVDVVANYLSKN